MKQKKITDNSIAFIYDDIEDYYTSVFLIEKRERVFVIDTYCGALGMEPILRYILKSCTGKEIIVINSHFHWDHIWGNTAFKSKTIIGHTLCRELMESEWDRQIKDKGQYVSGYVEKVLPSLTFNNSISFSDDGIEIFHSPGHTKDSVSVYDHEKKVLYTGDNLEKPIIYVEDPDIDTYIKTLKYYLSLSPEKIFSSHTIDLEKEDVENTINYLTALKNGKEFNFESEYTRRIHSENLEIIRHT